MKKLLLLSLLISIINFSFAQDGENPLPFVQHEPLFDTAPRFPGGPHALMKYVEDSVRYPEPEKTKGIQGNVYMKFDVTTEGKIINVKAVNGVPGGPNLVKEAERLLQTMPLWLPANKNGNNVEAEYTLSIPFNLKNANTHHK